MKALSLLLLALVTLSAAQNITFLDGSGCGGCDSVHVTYSDVPVDLCVRWETAFKHGKREGEERCYDAAGNLRQVAHLKNDEWVGELRQYYASGALKVTAPYRDGMFNGVQSWYREDGTLLREVAYRDWVMDGKEKYYYPSGKLAGTATYKNNKLVGYKECTDGRKGNESLDCLSGD